MNKMKILFSQTMIISTASLFAVGVEMFIEHFVNGKENMQWPWYIPLTFVLMGFLCALPTLLILDMDELSSRAIMIRKLIHFVCVGAILSACGFIFQWFTLVEGYIVLMVMYVLIYFFVWASTGWIAKSDEKKINEAIKGIQDKE